MTGMIKAWDPAANCGWIECESGEQVFFEGTAVVAFDLPAMCAHRAVSFERRAGRRAVAAYISLSYPHHQRALQGAGEILFRYIGFHQDNGRRVFRFERVCPGLETQTHQVSTDMMLFSKHRLAFQEAPSLCSKLLMRHSESEHSEHSLTEADLVEHAASRVIPIKKQMQRRKTVPSLLPGWNTIPK